MWGRMLRWAWQLPVAVALAGLAILALGIAPAALPAVYLAAVTPQLVRIDVLDHRLPNRIVLPGVAVGLIAALLGGAVTGEPPVVPVVAAAAGALLLAVFAALGGVGMGDVKLTALIGLASPTVPIALGALPAAFLLGGVAASIVLLRGLLTGRGQAAGRTHIAFGPYLLAGYWVALVFAIASGSMAGAGP
ncbi:MAG TPA: prepilin peptidase [Pseudolysinimonas sp.]